MGSGAAHFQFTTSALINDTIAIDAGCLGFYHSAQEQAKIKHVLITHTHIDHVASLPIFVENAWEGKADCVQIHGSSDVLHSIQHDIFNDRIWPDFIKLSENSDKPFLKLVPFEPHQTVELEGLKFTAVPMNHVVPNVGYLIEDEYSAVAFCSDTGPTEEIWKVANANPKLKAVFLEGCFPNHLGWLAEVSRHLTPELVGLELRKLTRSARVIIVHIKPRFQTQILDELKALNNSSIEPAHFGVPYSF
jgi:ribonuclease BN (tRNA processing enzyme)